MIASRDILFQQANWARFRAGRATGFYESFFQRANHPSRPLAFWIRYTLFSPRGRPEQAVGELWAIVFNGETGQHSVVKQQTPLRQCRFSADRFEVEIGEARLEPGHLRGAATSGEHTVRWDLAYAGQAEPLFLLPAKLYAGGFPKAKSLVGLPLARYTGSLSVDGAAMPIDNWLGSQNHNWGSQHTDDYVWGQVAGFDTHPDSFLEVASARLRLGPVWTPRLTPMVLRHAGREFALTALVQTLRARATVRALVWQFRSETQAVRVEGTISAPRSAFVGLRYANPPGGSKVCLNSKLAACSLTLTEKHGQGRATPQILSCQQRAAFEILSDHPRPGIPVRA